MTLSSAAVTMSVFAVMRGSRRCYEGVLNRYGRGATVLEFGCGPGFFAPYLARYLPAFSIRVEDQAETDVIPVSSRSRDVG